jgi:hypothetical protein
MNGRRHAALGAVIGAAAAVAPDLALATFGWRRTWLPEEHPLVRAHRLLHDPRYVVPVAVALAWASHVIADHYSEHRTGP